MVDKLKGFVPVVTTELKVVFTQELKVIFTQELTVMFTQVKLKAIIFIVELEFFVVVIMAFVTGIVELMVA